MKTFTGEDIINCFKELDKRLPSDHPNDEQHAGRDAAA